MSLRRGKVTSPVYGVLTDGPIGAFFISAMTIFTQQDQQKLEQLCSGRLGAHDDAPWLTPTAYMLRMLGRIRALNHGGTVLVVPDSLNHDDVRLRDRLLLKYACSDVRCWNELVYAAAWYRYASLAFRRAFPSNRRVKAARVTTADVREAFRADRRASDARERVDDFIHLWAALSGVDGAIVVTDRLRLLGYGAEVIAQSISLRSIMVASDSTGRTTTAVPIESFGTRHRSAFRFCASFEDSVAFVVSQDGSVRAAKQSEGRVVLWPELPT